MLTIKDTRLCFLSLQLKPSFRSLLGDLCLYFWLVLCEQPTQITNSWIVWPPHSSTALGPEPRPWEELNATGGGAIKQQHSSGTRATPMGGAKCHRGLSHQTQQHSSGTRATPMGGAKYNRGRSHQTQQRSSGTRAMPWEELNNAGVEPSNTTAQLWGQSHAHGRC